MSSAEVPLLFLTDSYKACHFLLYPEARKMVASGEFRTSFGGDEKDNRIVFCGMRYIIEHYIAKPWTKEDVDMAEQFFSHHKAKAYETDSPSFLFPKELFLKFVKENNGYFPVKIEAMPEGSVVYPHIPVYQITATNEYSRLVTYLESVLTMVWYPSTVATLSRRCKDVIFKYYKETVEESAFFTLGSRLHDFGFRGCTSVEQSIIGGCAHLLNFEGSDTMSAAFYAQFKLNKGAPVASSIPATEHSVMTSFRTERDAMERLIEKYGTGICACVMDSYDYAAALENLLPFANHELDKQKDGDKRGFLVIRPDSGNPVEVVLQALESAAQVVSPDENKKGFKVLKGMSVIQGDGISHTTISEILSAMKEKKFAASNVAFGMGGGLLQKVNRDTMSFATKLSHITYADRTERDVMKMPKTDTGKFSLPGELAVVDRDVIVDGKPTKAPFTVPKEVAAKNGERNRMVVVYDALSVVQGKPVIPEWTLFSELKTNLEKEWAAAVPRHNPISPELKDKIEATRARQGRENEAAAVELAAYKATLVSPQGVGSGAGGVGRAPPSDPASHDDGNHGNNHGQTHKHTHQHKNHHHHHNGDGRAAEEARSRASKNVDRSECSCRWF
ncbi:nicotinate phosphoribosyltransferase family-domain-containing protein [Zopfochytrium polystomum]|nr:nicotinate phosphoribosyltransferase family-domain-containing protein [Zopfochytrium polystomum]